MSASLAHSAQTAQSAAAPGPGTSAADTARIFQPRALPPEFVDLARIACRRRAALRAEIGKRELALRTNGVLDIAAPEELERTAAGGLPLDLDLGAARLRSLWPPKLMEELAEGAGMELPSDAVDAELSALLMESLLAPLLETAETACGARFRLAAPKTPERGAKDTCVRLDLAVGWADARAWPLILYGSQRAMGDLLERLRRLPDRPRKRPNLWVTLVGEFASVRLSLGEVESLRMGDAVMLGKGLGGESSFLIEERPSLRWPAALKDGQLHVMGGLRIMSDDEKTGDKKPAAETGKGAADAEKSREAEAQESETETEATEAEGEEPRPEASPLDAALADMEVQLRFELGRMSVRLSELGQIGEGFVLPLSRAPSEAVDIVAGGRRIGRGEIVEIGGSLGVRVTGLNRDG